MMLPKDEAVTASFMAVGMTKNDEARYNELIELWNEGCLELHIELCKYATLSEEMMRIVNATGYDFPGVYDYEVTEPFGTWFGDYILEHDGDAPTFGDASAALGKLVAEFFEREDKFKAGVLFNQIMTGLK